MIVVPSLKSHLFAAPESLVHDESIPSGGTFQEDLAKLQSVVEDNTPAYILGRLNDPPSEWIVISYVPDSAKVRDKVNPVYSVPKDAFVYKLS